MPRDNTRDTSYETFRISPIGAGGLDLFTDPALLGPGFLQRGENIRAGTLALERRKGGLKLFRGTDNTGALTFGATTKYATVTYAAHLSVPAGGWAFMVHITAVRPSGGNTGYILSSMPNSAAYHVLKVTISDAGVVTVAWRDSAGATPASR